MILLTNMNCFAHKFLMFSSQIWNVLLRKNTNWLFDQPRWSYPWSLLELGSSLLTIVLRLCVRPTMSSPPTAWWWTWRRTSCWRTQRFAVQSTLALDVLRSKRRTPLNIVDSVRWVMMIIIIMIIIMIMIIMILIVETVTFAGEKKSMSEWGKGTNLFFRNPAFCPLAFACPLMAPPPHTLQVNLNVRKGHQLIIVVSDLVHCCTLSLCHLGSEIDDHHRYPNINTEII